MMMSVELKVRSECAVFFTCLNLVGIVQSLAQQVSTAKQNIPTGPTSVNHTSHPSDLPSISRTQTKTVLSFLSSSITNSLTFFLRFLFHSPNHSIQLHTQKPFTLSFIITVIQFK